MTSKATVLENLMSENASLLADIATLDQESRQVRARLDRVTAERDEVLAVFRLVINEIEHRDRSDDGNAPGHSHDIPGVWDSDNGALAGKPCAWCATWAKAKELVAIASVKGETK
jgi:hypothetical protein